MVYTDVVYSHPKFSTDSMDKNGLVQFQAINNFNRSHSVHTTLYTKHAIMSHLRCDFKDFHYREGSWTQKKIMVMNTRGLLCIFDCILVSRVLQGCYGTVGANWFEWMIWSMNVWDYQKAGLFRQSYMQLPNESLQSSDENDQWQTCYCALDQPRNSVPSLRVGLS